MDETEFARRAVGRKLLTEEQLRDAENYAAGGRSLLAVLLDLGYLKPQDLGDLHAPASSLPSPPRKSARGIWIFFIAIAGLLGVLFGAGLSPRPTEHVTTTVEVPPPPGPGLFLRIIGAAEQRLARGLDLHRRGQGQGAEAERELQAAMALADEALELAPAGDRSAARVRQVAAHAQELLGRWETARDSYRILLSSAPDHGPALAGLARVLLYLGRFDEAKDQADRACAAAPSGETFLARAEVRKAQGDKAGARADLAEARRRDPALHAEANKLEVGLDVSR